MVETDLLPDKVCLNTITNLSREIQENGKKLKKSRVFMKGPSISEFFVKINSIDPKMKTNTFLAQSKWKQLILIAVFLLLFICSLIGVFIMWWTNVYDTAVVSNLVLKKNTHTFKLWTDPPVKPLLKIHIFNYTNVDRFKDGLDKKLRVEDVGPYVYQEEVKRVNYVFNGNGTVTYQEKRSYTFRPDLSGRFHQHDKIMVPNMPLISAVSVVRDSYMIARWSLSQVLQTLKSEPFVMLPAHRYLWGYEDSLFSLGKTVVGRDMPFDKMGVLIARNGTSRNRITINTGESDINRVGQIELLNGRGRSGAWSNDECDKISGTDGSIFPLNATRNLLPVDVYDYQLCRRLPFVFSKYVQFKLDVDNDVSIRALRYVIPKNVFSRPELHPENQCYCHMDSGECPLEGLFNATPCSYGAPAFTSFPHFYLGDPRLTDAIDGLKPDPEAHSSHIDIHPVLGFPLSGISRLQINFQVRKADDISQLDIFDDGMILPIIWVDVGLEKLPREISDLIYHATYSVSMFETILKVFFIIAALIMFSLLSLWYYRNYVADKKTQRLNRKPNEPESNQVDAKLME